jgi:ABC-type transporter Mla subunit MlaD
MSVLGSVVRTSVVVTLRAGEVAMSLPRIALALERLADSRDDLRRLADASDDVRRTLSSLDESDVAAARESLQGLVDAVGQLNNVVGSLNTTISPLQGATDRLGRLVDRLPAGRRRVIDAETNPYG